MSKFFEQAIPCWVCGKSISPTADHCPHCGHIDAGRESSFINTKKVAEEYREEKLKENKRKLKEGLSISLYTIGYFSQFTTVLSLILLLTDGKFNFQDTLFYFFFISLSITIIYQFSSKASKTNKKDEPTEVKNDFLRDDDKRRKKTVTFTKEDQLKTADIVLFASFVLVASIFLFLAIFIF